MTAGQAPILADAIASGECDTLSQAGDDILRVEHIAKRFGPITALRDVSLHLRRGEVLGLLGDNGAGHSRHRRAGGPPIGWTASGDRRRPHSLEPVRCAAARRADGRDGRQGGGSSLTSSLACRRARTCRW